MNKHLDFGNDLAALDENVNTAVGDVLQVLHHKRTARNQTIVRKEEDKPVVSTTSPDQTEVPAQTTDSTAPRRQRSQSRTRFSPIVERDEFLANVTTRLSLRTNELLTEVALRQRLKKNTPATRQDIIEAALVDWFRKHGYGPSHDRAEDN
jgi:hypothetical protein